MLRTEGCRNHKVTAEAGHHVYVWFAMQDCDSPVVLDRLVLNLAKPEILQIIWVAYDIILIRETLEK